MYIWFIHFNYCIISHEDIIYQKLFTYSLIELQVLLKLLLLKPMLHWTNLLTCPWAHMKICSSLNLQVELLDSRKYIYISSITLLSKVIVPYDMFPQNISKFLFLCILSICLLLRTKFKKRKFEFIVLLT